MEKGLLKLKPMLNPDTDMVAMEVMEDTVDMEDMVMERGLLKLMPNLDTDMVVMAMEVMEDTEDMEAMVMEKGLLKLMLNQDTDMVVMAVMVDTVVMDTMVKPVLNLSITEQLFMIGP